MKLTRRPVDQKLADEGVWLDVVGTDGNAYGSYLVRCAAHNMAYRAALIRAKRRLTRSEAIQLAGDNPDMAIAHRLDVTAFCEAILLDWRDIPVDKLPSYSPEAAIAFFIEEPWLFERIEEEAARETNFRKRAQAETAKN